MRYLYDRSMSGLGLACTLIESRPVVTGVIAEDANTLAVAFVHRADPNDEVAQQLRSIADDLETRLEQLAPDAVVVHSLDWFPKLKRDVAKSRFAVEGVLLAISQRCVTKTEGLDGRQIGVTCGDTKAKVEAQAAAAVGDDAKAAGAAALAALVISTTP
jgi:hypothetical protein